MSTFAELATWPGVGVNYLLDISTDRFATVSYRYSLSSQSVSGNMYEGRIVDMGKLQRGFGVDGLYAAGTVSMRLDNADGSLDWLTAVTTVESSVLRARFRLTLVLFDPTAPTDYATKVLGVFTCLDYPKRDDITVTLSLADDALGDAAELAATPTYEEWATESSQTLTEYVVDQTRPVQLVFGNAGGRGHPLVRPFRDVGAGGTTRPLVAYATTQADAAGATPPNFWISSIRFDSGIDISPNPGNTSGVFLFEMQTAGPITKDGRDWYVHWVQLNISEWWNHPPLAAHLLSLNLSRPRTVSGGGTTITYSGSSPDEILDALGAAWSIDAYPGSSRSYLPVNTLSTYDGIGFGVTGSDVVLDLLTHYCAMPITETAARIVTATFDAVRDAWPGARVAGNIADGDASATANGEEKAILQSGRLRGVLRDICRTTQMDLYADWDGKLRLSGATATYDATVAGYAGTLQRIEETRCLEGSVKVGIPSPGERWAPYNRLYLVDAEGRTYGPYDNGPNVTSWGRAIAKTIDLRWSEGWYFGLGALSFTTGQVGWAKAAGQMPLESKVRPVVTFEYPLEALLLDLGDYFVMSVTRGGNTSFADSYVDAIWRVESMALQPLTGYVTVTAVLSSDLIDELGYLLDDETLNVLADSGTYAGDPQVNDGNDVVTFTGGDLTAAGVDQGDVLILQDGTEGATSFKRNRGLLINEVTGATTLVLSSGEDLDFDSPGGTTVSTWRIVKGKTRLPTSSVDYPDGSYMYGANVVSGEYSDTSAGNRFKAG